MNRKELEARVAELERRYNNAMAEEGSANTRRQLAESVLRTARAELAAMPMEPRRATVTFAPNGRPVAAYDTGTSITFNDSVDAAEMIEAQPASEELLRALEWAERVGIFGCTPEIAILARELRARLPKP